MKNPMKKLLIENIGRLFAKSTVISLALGIAAGVPGKVLAQGALGPPGSPTPTMKSLDQIEPCIPISSLPYTILSAGSYYVTTNLVGVSAQSGITIFSGDVTVDLKGFTLTGVGGPTYYDGILVGGSYTNIAI